MFGMRWNRATGRMDLRRSVRTHYGRRMAWIGWPLRYAVFVDPRWTRERPGIADALAAHKAAA